MVEGNKDISRLYSSGGGSSGSPVALLIPLYLLLACFFVILNSYSSHETFKEKEALQGLKSQFETIVTDSQRKKQTMSEPLLVIKKIWMDSPMLDGIEPVLENGTLKATIDLPDFFLGLSPQLRKGQEVFLLKLISGLLGSSQKVKVRCVVGMNRVMGFDKAMDLAMKRSASIARFWLINGVPYGDLEVGIDQTKYDVIEFIFVPVADKSRNENVNA